MFGSVECWEAEDTHPTCQRAAEAFHIIQSDTSSLVRRQDCADQAPLLRLPKNLQGCHARDRICISEVLVRVRDNNTGPTP